MAMLEVLFLQAVFRCSFRLHKITIFLLHFHILFSSPPPRVCVVWYFRINEGLRRTLYTRTSDEETLVISLAQLVTPLTCC